MQEPSACTDAPSKELGASMESLNARSRARKQVAQGAAAPAGVEAGEGQLLPRPPAVADELLPPPPPPPAELQHVFKALVLLPQQEGAGGAAATAAAGSKRLHLLVASCGVGVRYLLMDQTLKELVQPYCPLITDGAWRQVLKRTPCADTIVVTGKPQLAKIKKHGVISHLASKAMLVSVDTAVAAMAHVGVPDAVVSAIKGDLKPLALAEPYVDADQAVGGTAWQAMWGHAAASSSVWGGQVGMDEPNLQPVDYGMPAWSEGGAANAAAASATAGVHGHQYHHQQLPFNPFYGYQHPPSAQPAATQPLMMNPADELALFQRLASSTVPASSPPQLFPTPAPGPHTWPSLLATPGEPAFSPPPSFLSPPTTGTSPVAPPAPPVSHTSTATPVIGTASAQPLPPPPPLFNALPPPPPHLPPTATYGAQQPTTPQPLAAPAYAAPVTPPPPPPPVADPHASTTTLLPSTPAPSPAPPPASPASTPARSCVVLPEVGAASPAPNGPSTATQPSTAAPPPPNPCNPAPPAAAASAAAFAAAPLAHGMASTSPAPPPPSPSNTTTPPATPASTAAMPPPRGARLPPASTTASEAHAHARQVLKRIGEALTNHRKLQASASRVEPSIAPQPPPLPSAPSAPPPPPPPPPPKPVAASAPSATCSAQLSAPHTQPPPSLFGCTTATTTVTPPPAPSPSPSFTPAQRECLARMGSALALRPTPWPSPHLPHAPTAATGGGAGLLQRPQLSEVASNHQPFINSCRGPAASSAASSPAAARPAVAPSPELARLQQGKRQQQQYMLSAKQAMQQRVRAGELPLGPTRYDTLPAAQVKGQYGLGAASWPPNERVRLQEAKYEAFLTSRVARVDRPGGSVQLTTMHKATGTLRGFMGFLVHHKDLSLEQLDMALIARPQLCADFTGFLMQRGGTVAHMQLTISWFKRALEFLHSEAVVEDLEYPIIVEWLRSMGNCIATSMPSRRLAPDLPPAASVLVWMDAVQQPIVSMVKEYVAKDKPKGFMTPHFARHVLQTTLLMNMFGQFAPIRLHVLKSSRHFDHATAPCIDPDCPRKETCKGNRVEIQQVDGEPRIRQFVIHHKNDLKYVDAAFDFLWPKGDMTTMGLVYLQDAYPVLTAGQSHGRLYMDHRAKPFLSDDSFTYWWRLTLRNNNAPFKEFPPSKLRNIFVASRVTSPGAKGLGGGEPMLMATSRRTWCEDYAELPLRKYEVQQAVDSASEWREKLLASPDAAKCKASMKEHVERLGQVMHPATPSKQVGAAAHAHSPQGNTSDEPSSAQEDSDEEDWLSCDSSTTSSTGETGSEGTGSEGESEGEWEEGEEETGDEDDASQPGLDVIDLVGGDDSEVSS